MSFISDYLVYRSNERLKDREFELALKELENQQIQESRVCESCETMKLELARVHELNNRLLDNLTRKPEEPEAPQPTEFKPIIPKSTPWNVRRQMLEAEDRAKARIERERSKESAVNIPQIQVVSEPRSRLGLSELEEELGVKNGD